MVPSSWFFLLPYPTTYLLTFTVSMEVAVTTWRLLFFSLLFREVHPKCLRDGVRQHRWPLLPCRHPHPPSVLSPYSKQEKHTHAKGFPTRKSGVSRTLTKYLEKKSETKSNYQRYDKVLPLTVYLLRKIPQTRKKSLFYTVYTCLQTFSFTTSTGETRQRPWIKIFD